MDIADQLSACLGVTYPAPGAEIRFNCPQCHKRGKTTDTHGHLYINVKKRLFFCQKCEWRGSVEWLFSSLGISTTPTVASWADTVRKLRVITGEDYREPYDNTEEIDYPCGTVKPGPGFSAYTYLTESKDKRINGLSCRGLTPSQIDNYRITLGAHGTRWEYRIFIPTLHDNLITFWVARDFSGEDDTKYLNPGGRSRRYHIFNLNQARNYDDVIITEGVFSAIAAGPNGIATFGRYVTVDQLLQLDAANFDTYYVALDGDAKPQTLYVSDWLTRRGKTVRVVALPPSGDPDSVDDFPQRLADAQIFGFKSRLEFTLNRYV